MTRTYWPRSVGSAEDLMDLDWFQTAPRAERGWVPRQGQAESREANYGHGAGRADASELSCGVTSLWPHPA